MRSITSYNFKNVAAGMPISARYFNALMDSVASSGLAERGQFTTSARARSESAGRPLGGDPREFFPGLADRDFDEYSVMGVSAGTNPDNRPSVTVHAAEAGDILVTNHNVAMTNGNEGRVTLVGLDFPTKVKVDGSASEGDEVGPGSDGTVSTDDVGLLLLTNPDGDGFAFAVLKPAPVVRIVEITNNGGGYGKIIQGKVKKITNSSSDTVGTTVTLADVSPTLTLKIINFRPNWTANGICYLVRKVGKFWVLENDACFQDFMV
jgi:hypothetical protein